MHLLWMKIIVYGVNISVVPGLAITYLIMYFSQEDRFYLLILLFLYPIGTYAHLKIMSVIGLTGFTGCSTIEYLIMRYQQINQQFKTITNNKNLNSLEVLIKEHNEVTVMVKDCDLLFSKLLGSYYLYARFFINLLLFVSIYGNSLIWARIIAPILAVLTIMILYLMSYLTAKVSTEAHRCYITINSINVRYKIPIPTKLKVRLLLKIVLKIDLILF